jgi:nitrile hydratase accessory protein
MNTKNTFTNDTTESMTLEGIAAPPLANGEVVFEAPWQGRVFGMARALCEQGYYDWDDFRACLINEIKKADANVRTAAEEYFYFDHFLAALTRLLDEKNLCLNDEVESRTKEFYARPHDHDH